MAKQARLDKFEIPAKIKLIPKPWTPESGLVTAALKIKREAIKKAYADDLAKLYAWICGILRGNAQSCKLRQIYPFFPGISDA